MSKRLPLLSLLALLGFTLIACGPSRSRSDDDDSAAADDDDDDGQACGYPADATQFGSAVGDLLPTQMLADQAGEFHAVESFCGAAFIIHVDAPWNGPFSYMSEILTDLYNDPTLSGLAVVAALLDVEAPSELATLASEQGIPYPVLRIHSSDLEDWGEITGIPHLIILDSEMRIAATGNMGPNELRTLVEELLP